jgi:hypothetical protein
MRSAAAWAAMTLAQGLEKGEVIKSLGMRRSTAILPQPGSFSENSV